MSDWKWPWPDSPATRCAGGALALCALALAFSGCGSGGQWVYRGVEPSQVQASIQMHRQQAERLRSQFATATFFDAARGADRPLDPRSPWAHWRMPYKQQLRVERHEAGVWRLMTRRPAGDWAPWHYQPAQVARFVAAGLHAATQHPVAVVACGTDVAVLLVKSWRQFSRFARPGPLGGILRVEPDWVDLDLSGLVKDPARWELALDVVERALWLFPVEDGALDTRRDGWRFAFTTTDGDVHRLAARVKWRQGAAPPEPAGAATQRSGRASRSRTSTSAATASLGSASPVAPAKGAK